MHPRRSRGALRLKHVMTCWTRAWLHPLFYNWNEQQNQFPLRLGASDAKFQRLITTNQRLTCSRGDVRAPSHSLLLLPCNLQSHDIADARQKRLIVWKHLSSSLC